jgi:peptide/nickel transport system ATP-binding protein
MEPLQVHRIKSDYAERKDRVRELFHQVGLNPNHINRYPHQFSGGQQQRICIARALALEPQFLIFDESVSALDVSIQAQILNMINELKSAYKFTSIFISHDLSVIHYVSDRILVMKNGKIIEEGLADKIIHNPEHHYTQQLIEAIPGKNIYKN